MKIKYIATIITVLLSTALISSSAYSQDDDATRNILKQGLLGAGTGAIASGASGGNAGTGALIGAGTGVIGGALLDMMTAPPARSTRRAPAQQAQYYDDEDYYGDEEVYYEEPPQESSTSKVLKQGLLGAGTGAIASGVSGGNAGTGALIGAGTGVIGGALLDAITTPSQPKRVYRRPASQPAPQSRQKVYTTPTTEEDAGEAPGSRKKVIRKYDDTGKVVSEEEIYY
ncbi:MAG: glycine zipper family protein [Candidatus Omnitrophota bacterium]|nr:glycine zipper family protein [Candidatus Omnitrophota bacterium]